MSKSIRIVVIDPHPIFREGVVRTIARSGGMSLVGEGKTSADARRLASTKTPDIVILDIAPSTVAKSLPNWPNAISNASS